MEVLNDKDESTIQTHWQNGAVISQRQRKLRQTNCMKLNQQNGAI